MFSKLHFKRKSKEPMELEVQRTTDTTREMRDQRMIEIMMKLRESMDSLQRKYFELEIVY